MQKLLVGKYDDAFCLVQMIGEDKCKVISTSSCLKSMMALILWMQIMTSIAMQKKLL